jgi:hypothetical protein
MTPARLGKVPEKKHNVPPFNISKRVEAWVLSHATLCLIVAICLLMALFVTLIFVLTGVSATESGVQYNQFSNII